MEDVSRATVRELRRQLNRTTPWHVRVKITVHGCAVETRVTSWRWLRWETAKSRYETGEADALRFFTDAMAAVQWFISNATQRPWPSTPHSDDPFISPPSGEWIERSPTPRASIRAGEADLWWEQNGQRVLSLAAIPSGQRANAQGA
jgi:hypothetical protein